MPTEQDLTVAAQAMNDAVAARKAKSEEVTAADLAHKALHEELFQLQLAADAATQAFVDLGLQVGGGEAPPADLKKPAEGEHEVKGKHGKHHEGRK